MVERLQGELKGTTFVDLDGTLLTANSMRIFMRRLPGMLMKRGAVGAALGSLWWTTLRSLRMVSHRSMKWHLTRNACRRFEESDWDILAEEMAETVNPSVRDYIESRRSRGCLTYIATAAVEEYAMPLCRLLGYDGVLATKFTDDISDYEELNSHNKHAAIERLLHDKQLRLESFLTDHTDDLPTAKAYPKLTILVGASKKTADEFREAGITRYIS
ncbi:MAG: haloacid dehalogenase-like hydrolase [Muribaculaceae bacterium]|nr:haloacid dehalogenase-like hydrolase [Muribaculaceae bacterium]